MQLLVDVGNSRIKWAFWNGVTLCSWHVASHSGFNFDRFLHRIWRELEAPSKVWVANVAGLEIEEALTSWVGTIWQQTPVFLETQEYAFGVTNGYQEPHKLGLDRWLGLIAGFNEYGQKAPVCIVDCGTSLTVDVINKHGKHLGGLLLPGIHTMRQALSNFTDGCSMKPRLSSPSQMGNSLLATNTEEGMIGGTIFAAVAYVERFLSEIEDEIAEPLKLVITGGEAELILSLVQKPLIYRPNLVLEGIAYYSNHAHQEPFFRKDHDVKKGASTLI